MGVTYKLKDEIISFITLQKRENPQISCRSLSGLIEEKFSIKVSKSAINTVLKEANLSSPIGRTSRKFVIPLDKKNQLLPQNPEVVTKPVPKKTSEVPTAKPLNINQENLKQFSDKDNVERKRISETRAKDSLLQNAPRPIQREKDPRASLSGDCFEQETFVEIKFKWLLRLLILRDFFSLPVLDVFFKRNTSLSQRDIEIVDVLLCFYPEVLDSPQISLQEENTIFWKILGWKDIPDIKEIDSIVQYLKTEKISVFDFNLEAQYFLTSVTSIDLIMEDDQTLTVDGRMRRVIDGESSYACPIEKAFFQISNFLAGNEILMLRCSEESFSLNIFEKIVNACDRTKGVKKIVFNGIDNQIVSQFEQVSTQPKRYVLNANMTLNQWEERFGSNIHTLEHKLNVQNREIYFSDQQVKIMHMFPEALSEQMVRRIDLYEPGQEVIKVVLTNLLDEQTSVSVIFDRLGLASQTIDVNNFREENEDSMFSTMSKLTDQKELHVLLGELLETMQKRFVMSNFSSDNARNMALEEKDKTIAVKYSKNLFKIKVNVNKETVFPDLFKVISHLFPFGYGRTKISASSFI